MTGSAYVLVMLSVSEASQHAGEVGSAGASPSPRLDWRVALRHDHKPNGSAGASPSPQSSETH